MLLNKKQKHNHLPYNLMATVSIVGLALTIPLLPAFGQQIILDGNTKTQIQINNKTSTITTKTIKGNNAFNSFKRFNINKGNTVNLVLPDSSDTLINLIHNEQSSINGTLNSIKNSQIGGNVFFINPYGITVGSQGIINVGSLTAITPSANFMKKFFKSPDNPNPVYVDKLFTGDYDINSNAEIINNGSINAIESVKLDTSLIQNSGQIKTNNDFSNYFEAEDVVNTGNLIDAADLSSNNGEIILLASDKIINTGTITTYNETSNKSNNITLITNQVEIDKSEIIADTSNVIISRYSKGDIIVGEEFFQLPGNGKGKAKGLLNNILSNIFLKVFDKLELTSSELSTINANSVIIGNHTSTNTLTEEISFEGDYTANHNLFFRSDDIIVDGNLNVDGTLKLNATNEAKLSGNINTSKDLIIEAGKKAEIIASDDSKTTTIKTGGNIILNTTDSKSTATIGKDSKRGRDTINISSAKDLIITSADEAFISGNNTTVQANNINITASGKDAGIYNKASISTLNSFILDAPKAKVIIDGDITAGTEREKMLNVHSDGNIDPASTIIPSINASEIIVNIEEKLGGEGGTISITGKKVSGKGSLTALGGSGNVQITNHSHLDLNIENLNVAEGSSASIFINGNNITDDYQKIDVYLNNSTTPSAININNMSASDVILTGLINSQDGPITIYNELGNILNNDFVLLSAPNIILSSPAGTTGSSFTPMKTDLGSGFLSVNAGIDVNLTETIGDLTIDTINALQGTAYVNIQDGSLLTTENPLADITAQKLNLLAGNIPDRLLLNIASNSNIYSAQDAYIEGTTGNLIATIAGTLDYSNINAHNITANASKDVLLSNGFINGNAQIESLSNTVVGSKDEFVDIKGNLNISKTNIADIHSNIDGIINIQANDVNLVEAEDINIGTISTNNDSFIRSLNGNILDATLDEAANISAHNILLSAQGIGNTELNDLNIDLKDSGTLTATALSTDIFLTENSDDLIINQIAAQTGNITLKAPGTILNNETSINEATIIANNLFIKAGGIGSEINNPLYIDLASDGLLTAIADESNIYIEELSSNININHITAARNDIYLTSAGSILDGNEFSTEAKIAGQSIYLTAGTSGNIGSSTNAGILEIQTEGSLYALAQEGSIYLEETGPQPEMIIDTIQARDSVYLHADWKIQNFEGATITATSDSGTINLITDDTKLYDDASNSGGTITTGNNGIVTIGRMTSGDIYASYEGEDNFVHPKPGETTYVTTRELGTISTGFVDLDAPLGEEIWDNTKNLNIIIDDNYDFINHPVDVQDGSIFILRKTDGILTLGGSIDDIGIITQQEIDNIIADEILIGNVLDPTIWEYGDTIEIRLNGPDFSTRSSTGGPADVTLATSGSIIDADPSTNMPIKSNNLTIIAGTSGIGGVGSSGHGFVDTDLSNEGKLNVNSTDDIYVYNISGNLYVDKVVSTSGSVYLSSLKDMYDSNEDEINVVAANDIYFYSNIGYSIGSIENPIEINSATSGTGGLSARTWNLFATETEGDLYIKEIYNTKKATTHVYLSAIDPNGASILDYNPDIDDVNNISATSLWLNAPYGSIGSGELSDTGDLDINHNWDFTLESIEAGLSLPSSEAATINLHHTGGGLRIGEIKSNENSTITVRSSSYIVDKDPGDNQIVDVSGNSITLHSNSHIGYAYFSEYNGYRNGLINIQEIGDNPEITATALDVVRLSSTGDMHLKQVRTYTSLANASILLIARNGDILNTSDSSDPGIIAPNSTPLVRLYALDSTEGFGGNIGTIDNPLKLNIQSGLNDYLLTHSTHDTHLINTATAGTLQIRESFAGGDYNINSSNTIQLVRNLGNKPTIQTDGNININSTGLITDYLTPIGSEYSLLIGNDITITSNGDIGGAGIYDIDLICRGKLNLSTQGSVYIESFADLNIDTIDAEGYVWINSQGYIDMGNITTSGDVTLTANDAISSSSAYPLINISGATIDLISNSYIGSLLNPIEIISSTGIINSSGTEVYINQY
jgi:filamentous hemagglutinin family protein